MKLSISTVLAASVALGAGVALADTASSDKDRATMEQQASPSNATKQDEERTGAHSQPDTPQSGAASPADSASGASSSSGSDQPAAAPQKPTLGEHYRSNENKADSTKSPPQ